MNEQIRQIAERIRGLRIIMDISTEEMARICDTSEEDYISHENGEQDFSFTFLYKCAKYFGVDIAEIITGDKPNLSFYTIVRKNEGLPIKRRKGFDYQHLAYLFKEKVSEPFFVTAKYDADAENSEIELSTHEGEEFDFILEGSLRVRLENHIETLNAGDCIYYNSSYGHGMVAIGGRDCKFLAVVMEKKKEK